VVVEGHRRVSDVDVHGTSNSEQAASIRAEAERVVRTIETVGRPFCDGWPDWQPEARWAVPQLPDGWTDVA